MKRIGSAVIGVIAATAMLATAVVSEARPGQQKHDEQARGQRGKMSMMRCLKAADLNEAQKAQVEQILESSKEAGETLRREAGELRENVKTLVDSNASDAELGAAVRTAHEAGEALRAHRDETGAAIKSIMTAEQQLRFEGCASAHGGKRHHKRG